MNCSKINFDTWARRDVFRHFIQDIRCVVGVTAQVDVTKVLALCREKNRRFYPVFLYLVAKTLNGRDEFKIRYNGSGDLVMWHTVSPSHIVFHPEDELFTRLVTEYSPDLSVFYESVVSDMALHRDKRSFEVDCTPEGIFDASCLPWLHYTACDLHVFDGGTYLAPIVTWGKYEACRGKLLMPLTMQIHHAVADGFHIARFFADLRSEAEALCLRMEKK